MGGELIAVTQAAPAQLAAHLQEYPRPFPVVGDPERAVYRLFGLERGSWSMFFRPRVLAHYLKLLALGWRLRWPRRGEDVLQLGGDFVLDADRRLRLAHRSADPQDRPDPQRLIDVLRQCRLEEHHEQPASTSPQRPTDQPA